MWLFSTAGFFSVVQKKGDTDLTLRARIKGDLEALRERFLSELSETIETPRADYPYRATVRHEAFAAALAHIVCGIHYDNFKNEVSKSSGRGRAHLYGEVWKVMYESERKLN